MRKIRMMCVKCKKMVDLSERWADEMDADREGEAGNGKSREG